MKNLFAKILAGSLLVPGATTFSQIFITQQFDAVNLAIPDNDPFGVSDSHTVSASDSAIMTLKVVLNLTGINFGAYDGDYFGYVTHNDRIAILLNRPGRDSGHPSGSPGNGFTVTFDDNAPNGDIHTYTLGNPALTLAGAWAPDGRAASPTSSLTSDGRTKTLNQLVGQPLNGEWTLFLADFENGGTAILTSWEIQAVVVPELPSTTLLTSVALLALAAWRRRQHTR